MNIIVDNYIWFLISGGVLFLITIGYVAEQTGFGKKKMTQDADETVNSNVIIPSDEQLVATNVGINDIYDNEVKPIDDINLNAAEEITNIPNETFNYDSDVVINEAANQADAGFDVNNQFIDYDIPVVEGNNIVSDVVNYNEISSNNIDVNINRSDSDVWKF